MPVKKKSAPVATTKVVRTSPELNLINDLAAILNATGLSEIELEQKGIRVKVSRSIVAHVQAAAPAALAHAAAPVAATPAKPQSPADNPGAVKSPMVGTAYLSSSPESPPFIAVGATVKEGQTVLIIEAMKTMNQIPAPRSGKVTQILVGNSQPVEFGEVLMVIE